MNYIYHENQTKVKNAMSYLQKSSKWLEKTIGYKDYTGWTPESQAIMESKLIPQVEAVKETINEIVQEEERAEIYRQLTEKPVNNIKVEPDKEEFILKDTLTGEEILKGNVEIIKGFLEVMYKMQNDNGTLTQIEDKKTSVEDEDNGEPF